MPPTTRRKPVARKEAIATRLKGKRAGQATIAGTAEDPITIDDGPTEGKQPIWRSSSVRRPIQSLSEKLSAKTTGLNQTDFSLLDKKKVWLSKYRVTASSRSAAVTPAVGATLVFAQEEAGTAVCISQSGLLLTCAHCIAESYDEFDYRKRHWLVFASGTVVKAACVAWDPNRDLALLEIVAAQAFSDGAATADAEADAKAEAGEAGEPTELPNATQLQPKFPHVTLAVSAPALHTPLCCIGHPGSEDLEASRPGTKTNYDVLHVSGGSFRGYALGQDVQDNAEIGALMHNCWTYWGHSGAPIVERDSGWLIGLHSSWDDITGMRRGVPLEAILQFVQDHKDRFGEEKLVGRGSK